MSENKNKNDKKFVLLKKMVSSYYFIVLKIHTFNEHFIFIVSIRRGKFYFILFINCCACGVVASLANDKRILKSKARRA